MGLISFWGRQDEIPVFFHKTKTKNLWPQNEKATGVTIPTKKKKREAGINLLLNITILWLKTGHALSLPNIAF